MTSTQFMRMTRLLAGVALLVSLLAGCGPRLTRPVTLASPYEDLQLWAVAPFANESGVSLVETDRVADMFVQQLQDVYGVNTLPVNRVIAAMRELDIPQVQSPGDARSLLNLLGADGLIVGTVTAYDPYRPMTFGAAVELHLADQDRLAASLNTRSLTRAPGDAVSPGSIGTVNPIAQSAGIFDARNHNTLADLQQYATGRNVPDSAYGADIYLVRMDLYMQFASYRLIRDLLESELMRLSPIVEESQ